MSERKKTNLIRLAVILGILIIAGALYVFGVFDDDAHFLLVNRADDDIFNIRLDISYTGDTKRDMHSSVQISGKLKNFQNDVDPIPYGEKIPMNPGHRKDVAVGDRAQIVFYVKTEQPKDTMDRMGEQVVNTPMDVPLMKGKRTVLILTGSKDSGYTLTPDGFVNWLIG